MIFYVNKSILRDLRVLGNRPLRTLKVGGCFCFRTNVILHVFWVDLFVALCLEQWLNECIYPTQYSEMRIKFSVAENRWASYCKRGSRAMAYAENPNYNSMCILEKFYYNIARYVRPIFHVYLYEVVNIITRQVRQTHYVIYWWDQAILIICSLHLSDGIEFDATIIMICNSWTA